VLRDSLQCVAPRGRACQIGFLGGLDPVVDFTRWRTCPARPSHVFAFDEIVEAHRGMDSGEAGGKVVVTLAGPAAS
jgi:NADPH2:quinone reductase